jgi:hypothetical protein
VWKTGEKLGMVISPTQIFSMGARFQLHFFDRGLKCRKILAFLTCVERPVRALAGESIRVSSRKLWRSSVSGPRGRWPQLLRIWGFHRAPTFDKV